MPWVLSRFFRTWTSIHPLKDLPLININIITTHNTKRATPAHQFLLWLRLLWSLLRPRYTTNTTNNNSNSSSSNNIMSVGLVWALISAIGQRRPRLFNVGGMEIVGWCFRGASILLGTSGLFVSSLSVVLVTDSKKHVTQKTHWRTSILMPLRQTILAPR